MSVNGERAQSICMTAFGLTFCVTRGQQWARCCHSPIARHGQVWVSCRRPIAVRNEWTKRVLQDKNSVLNCLKARCRPVTAGAVEGPG